MKLKINNQFYQSFTDSGLSTIINKDFLKYVVIRDIHLNELKIFSRYNTLIINSY